MGMIGGGADEEEEEEEEEELRAAILCSRGWPVNRQKQPTEQNASGAPFVVLEIIEEISSDIQAVLISLFFIVVQDRYFLSKISVESIKPDSVKF